MGFIEGWREQTIKFKLRILAMAILFIILLIIAGIIVTGGPSVCSCKNMPTVDINGNNICSCQDKFFQCLSGVGLRNGCTITLQAGGSSACDTTACADPSDGSYYSGTATVNGRFIGGIVLFGVACLVLGWLCNELWKISDGSAQLAASM